MGRHGQRDVTGILCTLAGGGRRGALDTQTVTSGSTSTGSNPIYTYDGFNSGMIGSIADGTSNIYGGAAITGLYFYQEGYTSPPVGFVNRMVIWTVAGSRANSGWTSMLVGSTLFNRVDASYTTGTNTSWGWTLPIPDPFITQGNPFGATTVVVWS